MTELFLIRHARAVERAASDWERALEVEGRREARAVGGALKQAGVHLDIIAASPLVRAIETATLIGEALGYDGALTIDSALTPDGITPHMIALCERLAGASVALVGHEPSMGQLLADLTGRASASIVKAGIVKLTITALRLGGCKQVWTISPRHLTPA